MTLMLGELMFTMYYLYFFLFTFKMMYDNTFDSTITDYMFFVSYNSRGFSENRKSFVLDLIDNYDILLLQEHWLLDDQPGKLHSLHESYSCHAVSGVDCSKEIISGRPFCGCAISILERIN